MTGGKSKIYFLIPEKVKARELKSTGFYLAWQLTSCEFTDLSPNFGR